ncbi:MAG: DUF4160 domain-containing protein [Pseudomonadota bacterium]
METGNVKAAQLPRRVARIVREWCFEHRQELRENWVKAQSFEPLDKIQGADRD